MLIKESKLRNIIRSMISETFRQGPGGLGSSNASIRTMTNDFSNIPVTKMSDIALDFDTTDPQCQEEIMNHWRTLNPGRPFPENGEIVSYRNNVNGFLLNYIYNQKINEWIDEDDLNEDLIDDDKMF
jgi:hypothetical protein